MTMPHLSNCEHQADGWCLECVGKLHAQVEELKDVLSEANWFVQNFPSDRLPGYKDFCTPIDRIEAALSS